MPKTWQSLSAAILVTVAAISPQLSHAGPLEDKCDATTDNNAAYRACLSRELRAITGPMEKGGVEKLCGSSGCIYRMKYVKEADSFVGGSFVVKYRPAENGRQILLTDNEGHVSEFFQCGTCRAMENVSGPIEEADIKFETDTILILSVKAAR